MTTLHILPNFDSATALDSRMDPFAVAAYRFIEYMSRRGWNMIHYGAPGSKPLCEHVDITGANLTEKNQNAGLAIQSRKKPDDMILCFYGTGNSGAAEMNADLKIIEPSIGYDTKNIFAPYRVFVSYAQQHMFYGGRDMLMNPSWFDAVIPNAFYPDEFAFESDKDDYLLYFGRVIPSKGVELCIQIAERTNHKLIIAGPGNINDIGRDSVPSFVEMAGLCNAEQRSKLMSKAKALLAPTYYVEPFGNMVVEALLSGTPVITTDWGGFTETNVHGITGFRCRDWMDFELAVQNIKSIDPHECRRWAAENYNADVVHDQFDRYFKKIEASDFYRYY